MTKRVFFSNFIWQLAERCGAQGVTFVVTIILARILEPEMYGTIALITVITTVFSVFVDSGLGTALIQNKDSDNKDFSTAFWFNCVLSIVLYVILYIVAPWISVFYDKDLTALVRVLSLSLLIFGVKNIQQAYVVKKMIFRKFFFATLSGTIVAAVVGIGMAFYGYGVWAIAVQGLVNSTIDTIVLWCITGWKPQLYFSISRLMKLLDFGWKMFASAFLDTFCNQLQSLVIGKKYSATDLAYYNKGNSFPYLFISNINYSLDRVLFPTLSKKQNDIVYVREHVKKGIVISTYFIFPIMVLLGVMAKPLVRLLLTDKWLPIVPFMWIFCFSYALWPIHTINLNAIKSLGKSDIFLKLEVVKKLVSIVAIVVTMQISVMAMAYSIIITSVIGLIINTWPNKKLLDYGYLDQMKDIFGTMILSILMGTILYPMQYLNISEIGIIILQLLVGIIFYLTVSFILKSSILQDICIMFKNQNND